MEYTYAVDIAVTAWLLWTFYLDRVNLSPLVLVMFSAFTGALVVVARLSTTHEGALTRTTTPILVAVGMLGSVVRLRRRQKTLSRR